MKGTLVGAAVLVLLSLSVGVAAFGAISQTYTDTGPDGLNRLAVSDYGAVQGGQAAEEQGGVFRAFAYVCPFH